MHLFYAPENPSENYLLSEAESKHCHRVLRLKAGDVIHLTDGEGKLWQAIVADASKKQVLLKVKQPPEKKNPRSYLHLALAPPKNTDRQTWLIEKATEIGLAKITFLRCEHSENYSLKLDRLQKNAIAALKQSLGVHLPIIYPEIQLAQFLERATTEQLFIAHCGKEDKPPFSACINANKPAILLIGPEGDFTPSEIKQAIAQGFKPVSLGSSRLRTETAGIWACSVSSSLMEL